MRGSEGMGGLLGGVVFDFADGVFGADASDGEGT